MLYMHKMTSETSSESTKAPVFLHRGSKLIPLFNNKLKITQLMKKHLTA